MSTVSQQYRGRQENISEPAPTSVLPDVNRFTANVTNRGFMCKLLFADELSQSLAKNTLFNDRALETQERQKSESLFEVLFLARSLIRTSDT